MNRPDIKTQFPKDTNVEDVVKTALDNPWYKYAGSLDNYIDYLLEKMESSQPIIIAPFSGATVCPNCTSENIYDLFTYENHTEWKK